MLEFKRLSKLHKYGMAISFLAMEIFALMAFSFGDNFILYGSLSLALMVLLILFNIKQLSVDGFSSIAYILLPLFLFTVICAIGYYFRPHQMIGNYKIGDLLFIPLGLLPLCVSGYILSIDKSFKPSILLVVIFSSLGLISLINLFANIVNFGFFYPLIYKGYHMYYGGVISNVPVEDMAYTLEGFKFIEVNMAHYVMYPALLFSSLIGLPFINPKENTKTFIVYVVFAFIGLLALVFVPSLLGLVCGIVVILITGIIYLLRRFYPQLAKPSKIVIYVLFILGILLFLFMFLNNQSKLGFNRFTSSNSLLNKIFNTNKYVSKYNVVMSDIFYENRFFGFAASVGSNVATPLSGSVLFDSCMMAGFIGPIVIIAINYFGFKGFVNYFKFVKEDFYIKALLVGFTSFATIFFNLFYDAEYGIYYSIHKPAIMAGPYMLVIFILCYVLAKGSANIVKEEKVNKEEAINA